MDAHALLRATAAAYANLEFLQAKLIIQSRTQEEGHRSLTEQTARVAYSRPNRARIEHLHRHGHTLVADGVSHHVYFHFEQIAERIATAELAGESPILCNGIQRPCHIVAVTYEPSPYPIPITIPAPFRFHLDKETGLVLRREFDMIYHPRHLPAPHPTTHTIDMIECDTTTPPDPALFTYTPPPGVEPEHHRTGTISAVAGARSTHTAQGFEGQSTQTWQEGDLLQRTTSHFHGHEIRIERTWHLTADPPAIQITERIQGPAGPHERTLNLPLP